MDDFIKGFMFTAGAITALVVTGLMGFAIIIHVTEQIL